MRTSTRYIDMVGHASTINGAGNIIDSDIQRLNKSFRGGERNHDTTFMAIHEFLTGEGGEDNYEEFIDSYRYELQKMDMNIEDYRDDFLNEVFDYLHDPIIAMDRIVSGYQHGLIDTINNAFLKTDRGWINDEQKVILPVDATQDDVVAHISSLVRVVPSFTIKTLEQAELTGELFVNDRLMAYKENGDWVDTSTNKKFATGELIRLLHHRNDPMVILTGVPSEKLYHATVSQSKEPDTGHVTRKGMAMQGDAVYTTTSVNEAVKIYGNPHSYEIRGKLLDEHEKGVINRDKFIFGHLYEVDTNANLYKADLKTRHLSFNDVPGASAILLLAKEAGASEGFAQNWWMMMKAANNTYDAYCAINEFSGVISGQVKGDNNCLKKIYAAMGFEGLEIKIPSKVELDNIQSNITAVENMNAENGVLMGMKRDPIVKKFNSYLQHVKEGIPAKAQGNHVLIFDQENMVKRHVSILPLNKKVLGKDDYFYSGERDIELNDILIERESDCEESFSY